MIAEIATHAHVGAFTGSPAQDRPGNVWPCRGPTGTVHHRPVHRPPPQSRVGGSVAAPTIHRDTTNVTGTAIPTVGGRESSDPRSFPSLSWRGTTSFGLSLPLRSCDSVAGACGTAECRAMLQRCFHCWSAVCHSAIAVAGRAYPGAFRGSPTWYSKARNCCRSRWTFPGLPRGKGTIAVIRICGLIDRSHQPGDARAPAVRTVLVSVAVRTTAARTLLIYCWPSYLEMGCPLELGRAPRTVTGRSVLGPYGDRPRPTMPHTRLPRISSGSHPS